MPQPSSGSRRYFKAQLRPLTKPAFWASASLFGISLVALASLFAEPNKTLSSGDRDAVVNLDNNDSLTPEERARAAEIDDLSVLLKDLDKRGTIDSVSGRLNEQQTANLDAPKAIDGIESSINKPSVSPAASSGDFQQLPLLDLNPQQPATNLIGQTTGNSGFVGFDPRSSGQVGGISNSASTTTITPLAAALDRNNAQAGGLSTSSNDDISDSSTSSNAALSSSSTIPLSNGISSNGTSYQSPNLATPGLSTTSLSAPTYGSPQNLTPQNSSDNAYSQILNPNLVVPTTPVSPALPSSLAPLSPVAPALPSASLNIGPTSPSNSINGGVIVPSASPSPQTQNTTFGAPTTNSPAPVLTNPSPFSVPNTTPNQASGNGKINTFANP